MDANTSAAIQAIASVVNLVIVVLLFVFEVVFSYLTRRREKKAYWYHETILSQSIPIIVSNFNDLFTILDEIDLTIESNSSNIEDEIKIRLSSIRKYISNIKRTLLPFTKMFNDTKLNKLIRESLEGLEDFLTSEIEKGFQQHSLVAGIQFDLSKRQSELLKILYNYDAN